MFVAGHSPRRFVWLLTSIVLFYRGWDCFSVASLLLNRKNVADFLQVFSQNCVAIYLFRRISAYWLSPVILLNSFLLSCVFVGIT